MHTESTFATDNTSTWIHWRLGTGYRKCFVTEIVHFAVDIASLVFSLSVNTLPVCCTLLRRKYCGKFEWNRKCLLKRKIRSGRILPKECSWWYRFATSSTKSLYFSNTWNGRRNYVHTQTMSFFNRQTP